MDGPEILARSLTNTSISDKFGNGWQYHSRSDNHSKIACWGLFFDLLQHCPLLVSHIASGKVGFGINHEMRDFKTNRKKYLDLVISTPGGRDEKRRETFAELVGKYNVRLTDAEAMKLASLPVVNRVNVGSVHIAMEAKACMTEHIKALPRLYDELNSSHIAIHASADFAIAVGFAMLNMANDFISSDRNKFNLSKTLPTINHHKQPNALIRAVDKLREIPRRLHQGVEGFDAFGMVVLDMANDGSAVRLITKPPAPSANDSMHYEQMVRRIASLYAIKFANI